MPSERQYEWEGAHDRALAGYEVTTQRVAPSSTTVTSVGMRYGIPCYKLPCVSLYPIAAQAGESVSLKVSGHPLHEYAVFVERDGNWERLPRDVSELAERLHIEILHADLTKSGVVTFESVDRRADQPWNDAAMVWEKGYENPIQYERAVSFLDRRIQVLLDAGGRPVGFTRSLENYNSANERAVPAAKWPELFGVLTRVMARMCL